MIRTPKPVPANCLRPPGGQLRGTIPHAQIHWLDVTKNDIALNGAFATDDQTDYLEAWQSVDFDDVSAIGSLMSC